MRFSRHVIKAGIGLGFKKLETVLCSGLVVLKNHVNCFVNLNGVFIAFVKYCVDEAPVVL